MIKKLSFLLFATLLSGFMWSQEPAGDRPQRTPEEEAMKQTMRQILEARQKGQAEIIGFIADQSPKWQATHHWTPFLRHQTAFFIGSERIARQVDAALYYVRVTRPRRGYYRAELVLITLNPQSPELDIQSEYPATDRYTQLLEQQIREQPELWLWTHNRWKRTYEQWLERNQ